MVSTTDINDRLLLNADAKLIYRQYFDLTADADGYPIYGNIDIAYSQASQTVYSVLSYFGENEMGRGWVAGTRLP